MPDLLAGTTILALDTPPTQRNFDTTDETGFTNTGFEAGTTVVGTTFIAPTTERVRVSFSARTENNNTSQRTLVSFELREGAAIGSGTLLVGASDGIALETSSDSSSGGSSTRLNASNYRDITAGTLTPGDTYNVQLMHRVTGGSGDIFDRQISVSPLT